MPQIETVSEPGRGLCCAPLVRKVKQRRKVAGAKCMSLSELAEREGFERSVQVLARTTV